MKFREYLEDIPSIGSVYYVIDSRNNDIEQLFYEVTSIEDVKGGAPQLGLRPIRMASRDASRYYVPMKGKFVGHEIYRKINKN